MRADLSNFRADGFHDDGLDGDCGDVSVHELDEGIIHEVRIGAGEAERGEHEVVRLEGRCCRTLVIRVCLERSPRRILRVQRVKRRV